MPESLRVPFLKAVDRGEIRSMQNKTMAATPINQVGALLLGDAFNMRHPLTGGGMTVALNDVSLLCDMLRPPCDFTDVRSTAAQTASYFTARKPWAATINTLANALYQVFCGNGERWSEEMRQACFDYLRLGGVYAEGPISLLSGLNPRPSVLVVHFFMVALFGVRFSSLCRLCGRAQQHRSAEQQAQRAAGGQASPFWPSGARLPLSRQSACSVVAGAQVGRLMLPFPTPRKMLLGVQLIVGAAAIILPIIRRVVPRSGAPSPEARLARRDLAPLSNAWLSFAAAPRRASRGAGRRGSGRCSSRTSSGRRRPCRPLRGRGDKGRLWITILKLAPSSARRHRRRQEDTAQDPPRTDPVPQRDRQRCRNAPGWIGAAGHHT